MSLLPSYQIEESVLADLEKALAGSEIIMICTKKKYLQSDKQTMYEEWEIKTKEGIRLIMWTKHPHNRPPGDSTLNLTVATPDGKRGIGLLDLTQKAIVQFGGRKIS